MSNQTEPLQQRNEFRAITIPILAIFMQFFYSSVRSGAIVSIFSALWYA